MTGTWIRQRREVFDYNRNGFDSGDKDSKQRRSSDEGSRSSGEDGSSRSSSEDGSSRSNDDDETTAVVITRPSSCQRDVGRLTLARRRNQ